MALFGNKTTHENLPHGGALETMGTRSQFYSVRLFSIVLWLTLFRLEDFLEDDEIRCIKEMSMQYANLGDYFFAPKKVFTSKKVMSQ